MPKRMLDDSLLTSASLAKCSPRAQDAFPRFILLCDDFGCFEVIPRALAARGWVYRQDVTESDMVTWLEEYVAAGMACLWTQNERRYCYLTGWDGEHGQRKRAEYDPNAPKGTPGAHGSKRRTPAPPAELVAAVRAGIRRDRDGKPPGTSSFPPGNAAETKHNDFTPAREFAGSAREIRGSAAPVPVPVPDPGTTHTLGRASGEADREAIEAKHDNPPHPLMDAVVMALRSRGLKPQYPRNGMRSSVEAAIEAVGVDLATERIVGGWVVSKPWLSYYLDKIAPPPPEVRRRPVVLPPADGWEPAPGPPPDEPTPLFPDDP